MTDKADFCRGQRIAFNALLNACAKTGMMRAAEELLESMLVEGPPPDIISYNTLISGYAQVLRPKIASPASLLCDWSPVT